jgi:hypothetical protein
MKRMAILGIGSQPPAPKAWYVFSCAGYESYPRWVTSHYIRQIKQLNTLNLTFQTLNRGDLLRRYVPKPEDVRFTPILDVPPLAWPKPAPADHLCLWLACSRVLCRDSRHCNGPNAPCVFEQPDVKRPLLEAVVRATFGRR